MSRCQIFGWMLMASCFGGCSLFAPSDLALGGDHVDEAGSGGVDGANGAIEASDADAAKADSSVDSGSSDTGGDGQPPACGVTVQCNNRCCNACNGGQCAGCALNGRHCEDNTSCCDGTCTGGICGPAVCASDGGGGATDSGNDTGADAGADAGTVSGGCSSPDECCTGTCIGGSCTACLVVGSPCAQDTDCCTLVCAAGTCTACLTTGQTCAGVNARCCTGHCSQQDGVCVSGGN